MFWVIVSLYGMCFGGLCCTFGVSVVRWFGVQHCTQAFGYVMMGAGIGAMLGPPVAGENHNHIYKF